jgi:hypothetical protein
MIGHSEAAAVRVPEDDVASCLVIDLIADVGEYFHCFLSGTDWKLAHVGTSTISSVIGGGMGSPCFLRLAR